MMLWHIGMFLDESDIAFYTLLRIGENAHVR